MFCRHCGTENAPGAAFCARCGAPLGSASVSSASMSSAPAATQRRPPRKNNLPILVGLSIALVLAIGVGAFALIKTKPAADAGTNTKKSDAEIVLIAQNFIGAIYNNNYTRVNPSELMSYGPIARRCVPYMRPGSPVYKKIVKQIKNVYVNNSKNYYSKIVKNVKVVKKDARYIVIAPTIQGYIVSFDANGGNGYTEDVAVEKGQSAVLPTGGFTRDKSKFTGWNTSADGSGQTYAVGGRFTPTEDTTLYAQWSDTDEPSPTKKTYTVSFDANGGEGSAENLVIEEGNSDVLPIGEFQRADYEFESWNTSSDGKGQKYLAGAVIAPTQDTTLYAQWTQDEQPLPDPKTLTISFDANGGAGTTEDLEVDEGKAAVLPIGGFSKDGHTFDGWNTSADGSGQAYAAGSQITPTDNVTLYAQWKKAEADPSKKSFTVTFDANGGTGDSQSQTVEEGQAATAPDTGFERDEYTLSSWNTSADGSGQEYGIGSQVTPIQDMTLYAQWEKNEPAAKSYTVTFDANGGTGDAQIQIVEEGKTATAPSTGFERDGYDLEGWGLTPDGGSAYPSGSEISVTEDATLYAQWKKREEPKEDNSDQGETQDGSKDDDLKKDETDQGETQGGSTQDETGQGDSKEGETEQGGSIWDIFTPEPDTKQDSSNQEEPKQDESTQNTTKQEESKQDETQQDGSTPTRDTETTSDQTTTSDSTPSPKATYTVSFDLNGGSGYVQSMQVEEGSYITLPASGITRSGYEFAGWGFSSSSGSAYPGGSSFSPTSNTTLYAQWTKIESSSSNRTSDSNKDSNTNKNTESSSTESNKNEQKVDTWEVSVDDEGMVTDIENTGTDVAPPADTSDTSSTDTSDAGTNMDASTSAATTPESDGSTSNDEGETTESI